MAIKTRVTIQMGYRDALFDFDDGREAVEFAYLAASNASSDNEDVIEARIKTVKVDDEESKEEENE